MIDNPLPDQVMQEKETLQSQAEYELCCKEYAREIAMHFKVHDELHYDFAEWYYDFMCQNPELFDLSCIYLDSDYIVDWWKDNYYLYDDFDSPYMEIKQ